MNHLPYVVASYVLAILVCGWFAVGASLRLRQARQRLAVIDPRAHDKRTGR